MALINLRNALMAGKRLPYDAEVEYLESTGTQWVDTGFAPQSNAGCEIMFEPTEGNSTSDTYQFVFGSWGNTSTHGRFQVVNYNRISEYGFGKGSGGVNVNYAKGLSPYLRGHTYVVKISGKVLTVNGQVVASLPQGDLDGNILTAYLFKANDLQNRAGLKQRLFYARFYAGSDLVRDFTPVRIGSGANAVGYMYDRVSGKLFGNVGTGAFIIGPDKVSSVGGGV